MLRGIGASSGIAIGKVFIKKDVVIEIDRKNIGDVAKELERLDWGVDKAKSEVDSIYHKTRKEIGEQEAQIFAAHMMMLEDPEFFGEVREKIKIDRVNSEWAIKEVFNNFEQSFKDIENEYIKERISDLRDITERLIRILSGVEYNDLSQLSEEVIIVSKDLNPSETAQMDKKKVLGFVTETGGKTSHTAIMARTLGIPAAVGVNGILDNVNSDDIVIVDGELGIVIINPEHSVIDEYKAKKAEYEKFMGELNKLKGARTVTKDGFEVELVANIGTPEDVDAVINNDGEGVGLFRTEFLYMNRNSIPTEEEQFNAYKIVAERLDGKPVVIRTLDIGGDKDLPYLQLPEEMNPFLGYRAIRLCLDRRDIFKTQLRAILRASAYGNIKIMFPMISSIEELRDAKSILEDIKNELREEDIAFDENIEVGIMVEIPAVAVMSDLFAKEVDFFSIGTNDLIQYTTAVDRGNEKISHLYNQFHPALLRLIKTVIDNGHKEGIWVGMCGEVAGDPKLIPVLIGMGLDEFSMNSASILNARWIINNLKKKDMENIVQELINLPTATDVESFINARFS